VPDILVVLKARLLLLRPTFLDGAPDVAFEIVSPDSVVRDWREKYEEYQAAGVREYWVIDPTTRRIEAYALRGKKYHRIEEDDGGRIASAVLGDFTSAPRGSGAHAPARQRRPARAGRVEPLSSTRARRADELTPQAIPRTRRRP
jgi:hypothetical protein